MRIVDTFTQDPLDVLPRGFDLGAMWLDDGETITAATWEATYAAEYADEAEPDLPELSGATFDDTRTAVTVTGGEAGHDYHLTAHVTTDEDRERDFTWRMRCRDR